MNNRTKVVLALVLLVMISAIGLRELAVSAQDAEDAPIVMANGGGPVPKPPWKNGGGPVPKPPWKNGGGPVPKPPWPTN